MHYVRNLDGVRGLAITLVIVFHYNFILEFGWVGVQLFFVLSGFLITSILLNSKDQSAGSYFGGFYWRRSLRIFPIYYLYLTAIGVLYILINNPPDFPEKAPWLFSYSYNLFPVFNGFSFDIFFTHLWSLCIEEQFYLLWPLLIFFLSKNQLKVILVFFILGAPVIRYFLAEHLYNIGTPHDFIGQIVYRFTFSQWDGFAFGAAIPVFGLQSTIEKPGKYFLISLIVFVAVGIVNFITLQSQGVPVKPSSFGYMIGIVENYQHVWSYSIIGITAMFFTMACLKPGILLDRLVGNDVMVFIGKISYGLYVYHWIIWMAFNKFVQNSSVTVQLLSFIPFVAACITVAYVSYRLIEKPLLAKKSLFTSSAKNGH